MSLIPIQMENMALKLVHGTEVGLLATVVKNSLTWSAKERTVGL